MRRRSLCAYKSSKFAEGVGAVSQSPVAMTGRRVFPWVLRVVWALLPLTAGPALAAGLDGRSHAVQLVGAIGLWAGWAVGLLATLVPHPLGLTALRLLAPGAVGAVVAAVVAGDPSGVATVVG